MTTNDGYQYRHVLCSKARGHTTLSYLAEAFSHSSEDEWRERLKAGEIWLDNLRCQGDEPLQSGKVLLWNRPGWVEESTPQSYSILYEDAHLLAIDKPSGLPTLPGAGFLQNTLVSLVRQAFPEAKPLHRLGRATSGVVLFARDQSTASSLCSQWSKIEKQYQALGSHVAREEHFDIQVPISKLPHPRLGSVYAACESGKHARSVARVLERRADSTLFEVDLHTGRPHQIRIHLAAIGHPLVGDPLYDLGGKPIAHQPGLPGDSGYWLHAKRVRLTHPVTAAILEIDAPVPAILQVESEASRSFH